MFVEQNVYICVDQSIVPLLNIALNRYTEDMVSVSHVAIDVHVHHLNLLLLSSTRSHDCFTVRACCIAHDDATGLMGASVKENSQVGDSGGRNNFVIKRHDTTATSNYIKTSLSRTRARDNHLWASTICWSGIYGSVRLYEFFRCRLRS